MEPEYDEQNAPNEPTAAADVPPIAPEEATAAIGDHRISPNELSCPPGAPNPMKMESE
jgi:hypothetical protein